MVLTTSQLRSAWGPACKGTRVGLTEAYQNLDAIMKRYNYRPRSGVTGAYNCRAITGGSNYSLHAYGPGGYFTFWTGVRVSMAIAVDINWDKNPYSSRLITDMPQVMVNEIKALRTKNGKQVWGWGGDYRNNKDAMHYEIVCAPADIATGIRGGSPTTPPPSSEENDMEAPLLVIAKPGQDPSGAWFVISGQGRTWVWDGSVIGFDIFTGLLRWDNNANGGKGGPLAVDVTVIANRPLLAGDDPWTTHKNESAGVDLDLIWEFRNKMLEWIAAEQQQ